MALNHATFTTSRTLPASPDAVWAAIQRPELLARWWGPDGFTNTFHEFDFKAGGRWVFDMHGPDGKTYANQNVFVLLEPGRQFVVRHDCQPYFTLTIDLAAVPGGTLLSWTQALDDVKVAQAVAHIVEPANEQNLDRLQRVLAEEGLA